MIYRIIAVGSQKPLNEIINFFIYLTPIILIALSYLLESKTNVLVEPITGEGIQKPSSTLQYQGVIIRATANLLDQILIAGPIFTALYIFGHGNIISNWYVTLGLVFIAYCAFCEALFGQTIGKKLVHIKVIMQDGRSCTWYAAILRNVGRLLDAILGSYILGIIVMILTKRKQRIGDLIAQTVVVKV